MLAADELCQAKRRARRQTAGDHNKRFIHNYSVVYPAKIPPGTVEKIEKQLLAKGTTWDNDPFVLALLKECGEH